VNRLGAAAVGETIALPRPESASPMTVEQAIARRRSCRDYCADALTLEQVSRLLWAAQGITGPPYLRAAPSAGACYPLQTYLIAAQGIFRFVPQEHALVKTADGDRRARLAQAAGGQSFVAEAPVAIAFAAVYERTTRRYGERGFRYVYMDVGAAAENVHLQAEALGLGSVSVGAFHDEAVAKVLELPSGEEPVYLIPIGTRAGGA
jgi:SagB-type dehydrogenase family enzyme